MKRSRNTNRSRVARQLAIAGALVLALTLVGSCSNMITDLTAEGDAGGGSAGGYVPFDPSSATTSSVLTNGGSVSSSNWNFPQSLTIAGGKMFVANNIGDTIEVFDPVPTSDVAASFSLTKDIANPKGVHSDGTRLVSAGTDSGSTDGRIFIWNTLPTSDTAPDVTITGVSNQFLDVRIIGDKLAVGDSTDLGIVNFSEIPETGTVSYGTLAQQLTITDVSNTASIWSDGTRLVITETWVEDLNNGRGAVKIWKSFPTSDTAPNLALEGNSNKIDVLSAYVARPFVDPAGKLYVPNSNTGEVFIYNSIPTDPAADPDTIISTYDANGTPTNLSRPTGALVTPEGHLWVVDQGENVLIRYE